MSDFISIAKITNFHGIKGEVKVGYTKGKEKQLQSLKEIFLQKDSAAKNSELIKLHIQSVRFHKNFAIMKFKGFDSLNEVLEFKNMILKIPKNLVSQALDTDEYLISDLVGMQAFDKNDEYIGDIIAISDAAGSDLLEIRDKEKKIHLVPFVKELVPAVDTKNKKILINNIDGLIE